MKGDQRRVLFGLGGRGEGRRSAGGDGYYYVYWDAYVGERVGPSSGWKITNLPFPMTSSVSCSAFGKSVRSIQEAELVLETEIVAGLDMGVVIDFGLMRQDWNVFEKE